MKLGCLQRYGSLRHHRQQCCRFYKYSTHAILSLSATQFNANIASTTFTLRRIAGTTVVRHVGIPIDDPGWQDQCSFMCNQSPTPAGIVRVTVPLKLVGQASTDASSVGADKNNSKPENEQQHDAASRNKGGRQQEVLAEDSGFDSDQAENLVRQLEAPSDDEEGSGDDFEVPTAISWSAIQYATYMTGMHHYVREKLRVQSYLASELSKAETEMKSDDEPKKRVTLDVRGAASVTYEVLALRRLCCTF